MNYQSLTPAQREHVAFLFADEVFGTDPNWYEYELMGEMVVGRAKAISDRNQSSVHVRKPHTVAVNVAVREVPSAFVTVECQREAAYAIQLLARSVVERLRQSQNVEA